MRTKYVLAMLVLLGVMLPAASAHAGGVVSTCNEADLLAALTGGGTVTFSCSGTITLASTIAIAANTTIDGTGRTITISGNNAVRVFTVNPGVSLTLKYLTVANGQGASSGGGGGVYNNRGTLTVDHITFSANTAAYGGAISSFYATTTVDSSFFLGNSTPTGSYASGGAIRTDYSTLTVRNSQFSGNSAGSIGGAIHSSSGTLTVAGCVFADNSGPDCGGGIANFGTAFISGSTFSGNNSDFGGGLSNMFGTATVSSSTFTGNSAGEGGGVYNTDASLTLSNSTFSANRANRGGGIFNDSWSDMSVINSTLSGNYAYYDGGAILAFGEVTLANTIVANSSSGENCHGSIVDGGGNLNYPAYPNFNCPNTGGDPLLGPLQNNGGPTQTMLLGPGSAAIDAANDAICAAAPVNNLDQRGAARPSGLHCDIGAVEQQLTAGPAVVIDIKPGSDPNSINCRNPNEVIAVAILTTGLFDATAVDHTTVTFHGAAETHVDRQTGVPVRHEEDVDGDGDMDLVFHFRLGSTTLTCQSTVGALWGQTFAGESIVATDSVRMVGGQ